MQLLFPAGVHVQSDRIVGFAYYLANRDIFWGLFATGEEHAREKGPYRDENLPVHV
jgi:hypothetical protein